MKQKRRAFLKHAGLTGLVLTTGKHELLQTSSDTCNPKVMAENFLSRTGDEGQTLIGSYGQWAASLIDKVPSRSFRRGEFSDIDQWRDETRSKVLERMGVPDIGGMPEVKTIRQYNYDGLHIEELTWQLPYGRPTEAILLKPQNAR
ncbi:MAG: hypothetical protein M3Y60_14050, partial [Bacteroidota bacterium]|nr:hypothetical protein [Bacteroidota bacterium]